MNFPGKRTTPTKQRIGETARVALVCCLLCLPLFAQSVTTPRHFPIPLGSEDVIATGNEWIALPAIRASDGAITSFNVLSMRDRGLLEVTGEKGTPAIEPYFLIDGKRLAFRNPSWELIEYWIPKAQLTVDGLEATITYCAPHGSRGAFIDMALTNRRPDPVKVALGLKASWGALNRVTYTPVELKGERVVVGAPWEKAAEDFAFITHDTHFAWSVYYPESEGKLAAAPLAVSPALDAQHVVTLAPGETAETHFVLGVGVEEYSASQAANVLRDKLDRDGVVKVIAEEAAWCRARTRTTGQPDLDMLMNRNFLFTANYAWGRALDTEQLVGVTSRSPRYYVSAAYWDRDAMLWSFPGLLDSDPALAKEALSYALTIQLRNAGTHSRFIDGIVLEDGFELDEAVAPIIATSEYVKRTNDDEFLSAQHGALLRLRERLLAQYDGETGLFATLQDAQDQYYREKFSTYDNVLVWRAMLDMAALFDRLKDNAKSKDLLQRADALRKAIMKISVSGGAPGAAGSIFVCATDGKKPVFAEVPPGSLLKLPALGFIAEDDPLFVRTYAWLHSKDHKYSYSDQPYGLPGSYRLPFSTSWSVADHLALQRGREPALKVLRASKWDGGIISEGVDPATAVMDYDGRAFATAAGYVAHAICKAFCTDSAPQ